MNARLVAGATELTGAVAELQVFVQATPTAGGRYAVTGNDSAAVAATVRRNGTETTVTGNAGRNPFATIVLIELGALLGDCPAGSAQRSDHLCR